MKLEAGILVDAIQDQNATVAEIDYNGLTATGSSKRNNGEVFNSEAGFDLALARALLKLSQELTAKHGYVVTKLEAK